MYNVIKYELTRKYINIVKHTFKTLPLGPRNIVLPIGYTLLEMQRKTTNIRIQQMLLLNRFRREHHHMISILSIKNQLIYKTNTILFFDVHALKRD